MDYDDQLERALQSVPDDREAGDRFQVPDPEVRAEGNVTVYENFQATLDRLDRDEQRVLTFLQSELGTNAGIDERGRARLTGGFKASRVADALEAFVDEYVLCGECGLPDTRIIEQGGTDVLKCDACGAITPLP